MRKFLLVAASALAATLSATASAQRVVPIRFATGASAATEASAPSCFVSSIRSRATARPALPPPGEATSASSGSARSRCTRFPIS